MLPTWRTNGTSADYVYFRKVNGLTIAKIGLEVTNLPLGKCLRNVYNLDACSGVDCSFIPNYANSLFEH